MANAKGFDGSHHNGSLDAAAAKAGGYSFGFWKVTEGSGFVDWTWPDARASAVAAGLPLWGYHLGRDTSSGTQQWAHFKAHAGLLVPGEPVCLDIEAGPAMSVGRAEDWIAAALADGFRVVVYGLPDDVAQFAAEDVFTWQVAWTSQKLKTPWTFKQVDIRRVPGIPDATTDYDEFNGDAAAFAEWLGGSEMGAADDYFDAFDRKVVGPGGFFADMAYISGFRLGRQKREPSADQLANEDFAQGFADGQLSPGGGTPEPHPVEDIALAVDLNAGTASGTATPRL